ncbi:hypothetical protein BC938DRAFT_474432, partial [Jimgerdemannia flammicorona]
SCTRSPTTTSASPHFLPFGTNISFRKTKITHTMPPRSKPNTTKIDPKDQEKMSKFFKEEYPPIRRTRPIRHPNWQRVPIPECVVIRPIVAKLREPRPEPDEQEELNVAIQAQLESDTIGTVRKESVFSGEVTEDELDIIQKRVALQQRQFAEYERRDKLRKSKKIRAMFDYVSDEEIDEMLLDCEGDEDEVVVRLTQPGYLFGIRRIIATKHTTEIESHAPIMSEEQKAAYQQLLKKRSETLRKTTTDQAKKQYRMGGRLALDDALKQVQEHKIDPAKAFEGWSQARIRAYQMIDQNPNSYYYRFNAPGEVQRKGQWTEEEKKLFHKRLDEVGANGQWGLFSMSIPGRVGYQCSNFYRLLIETKKIHDPNYVLDEKGKAHYLFDKKNSKGEVEKTFRTHSKHTTSTMDRPPRSRSTTGGSASVATSSRKRKRRNNRWGGSDDDEDDLVGYDDDDSGSFTMKSWSTTKRTRARVTGPDAPSSEAGEGSGVGEGSEEVGEEERERMMNPLPGFLDPVTLDEVVKPAISKYGHVMGSCAVACDLWNRYESWVRCLTNWEGKKNICPLTKKPLTKRDLIILTHENIADYRRSMVIGHRNAVCKAKPNA